MLMFFNYVMLRYVTSCYVTLAMLARTAILEFTEFHVASPGFGYDSILTKRRNARIA